MFRAFLVFLRSIGPRPLILTLVGLALAGGGGYLTAVALGVAFQEGAKTVTISVGTGEQGPPGPAGPIGPPGPAGAAGLACPVGYTAGRLVFNAPGGQVAIWTCLAN